MKNVLFRVLASKPFVRFARRFGINDAALCKIVAGPCDADLGAGLFKFRLPREGEGTSGGARALIALKVGERAVLMYGFEKKDQANINVSELKAYRKAARVYLGLTNEELDTAVKQKALVEISGRKEARDG